MPNYLPHLFPTCVAGGERMEKEKIERFLAWTAVALMIGATGAFLALALLT